MVKRPDTYELTSEMRVSGLIEKAEGILGESFLTRADLFRLNGDEKTTTVIPINLGLALQGDERHNLRLQQRDRLMVYSKFDVEWTADRIVSVQGAVENPGSFERSDKMKISDLVIQAGGISPEAHFQQATLFRLNRQLQMAEGIPIDLGQVLQNDPKQDLYLNDGDVLIVFRFDEVHWIPNREVSITGNVQRPGVYLRFDNMRISDLIFLAGTFAARSALKCFAKSKGRSIESTG
jgi:protein involved in polysaccharide export with SLBB domain